jgi:hypothetical protein
MEITLCINSKSLPFTFIVLSPLLLQSPPTSMVHRLQQAGLTVNANESNFGAHEMECSGCNVTHAGIQPIAKKVQAIQVPKTRKQLRGFIGMIISTGTCGTTEHHCQRH